MALPAQHSYLIRIVLETNPIFLTRIFDCFHTRLFRIMDFSPIDRDNLRSRIRLLPMPIL